MNPPPSVRPRVIVYVFASPYLRGAAEDVMRAGLVELCARAGMHLVEIVVDHGPPKRRASEYPALARLARGEADALLLIRSALFTHGRAADRLERLCPEGSPGWLTADALRDAGLLPRRARAHRAERPRRPAKQRAAELGAAGLGLRQVVQVLESEGYRQRGGLSWNVESVAALLGIPTAEAGRCEERRWSMEAPAAWRQDVQAND